MGIRVYITFLLFSSSLVHAFAPAIQADTNRDGVVT